MNRNDIMYEEKRLVVFYEAYRQAMADFCKATGFEIDLHQTIKSIEADAEYRESVVKQLNEIDEKYNY